MKELKIQYLGKEETIQVEDKPKAGLIMPIVKRAQKFKTGARGEQQVEIDEDEWFIGLCTNVITKAPWQLGNVQSLKDMDIDSYFSLKEAMGNEFPLYRFLYPGQKMLYGTLLEQLASAAQTTSTTSSASGESPSAK